MTQENFKYKLLPFNFLRIADKEVLINELGDLLVVPNETVRRLCYNDSIDEEILKTSMLTFL